MAISLPSATLKIELETLNQYGIWTGGAEAKKMDSLKSSSILGGLRLWTEALVRSCGGIVCNEQSRCTASNGEGACDLCRIFGCTGISRAFNFLAEPLTPISKPIEKGTLRVRLENHKRPDQKFPPTYYLTIGYKGKLTLDLAMRRAENGSFHLPKAVLAALLLMVEYGTIGAYDQYGCGLAGFSDQADAEALRAYCKGIFSREKDSGGASLRDFFFFKGKVKGSVQNPMGEIRYLVRDKIRNLGKSQELRHWFCGSLDSDQRTKGGKNNSGSKYAFTIDDKNAIYGWGYFPRHGLLDQYDKDRDAVLDALRSVLSSCLEPGMAWKEFGAQKRDPSSPSDWQKYLDGLIGSSWRNKA